jgi:hypothetical protein
MSVWYQLDKHKDATAVLTSGLGKDIAERMGIPVKNIDFVANKAEWKQCLTCHGVYIDNEAHADKITFSPADRVESGVSCVVCHGAHAEWVNEHQKKVGSVWKTLSRKQKEQDHGLTDLWDAEKRAALCSSCHIGNAAEGKVVTHEMYAAGHPPLPGFEILSFSDAMPRHWETMSEKSSRLPKHRELYEKAYLTKADAFDSEHLRLLNISSVVALRSTLQLIHDLARKEIDAKPKEAAWPELAAFDCYACHHDLKSDSWRQMRTLTGRPGRPQLRLWPTIMTETVIKQAKPGGGASAADYHRLAKDLSEVFDRTPFGEPQSVVEKAGALMKWSDQMIVALQRVDKAASRDMLASLLNRPEKELLDFDSARQIAWSAHALFATVAPESAKRAEVKKHLDTLYHQLHLELPKGQKRIAEDFLPKVLKAIGSYDPREFQKTMRTLAEAAKNKP